MAVPTETIHNIVSNYKTSNFTKINVYGIVTFIGSKTNNKCTNLTLVDDTCDDKEKLKCIVFDKNPLHALHVECELGDVVRLHRIKIQQFNDQPQGCVSENLSTWVRFKKNNPNEYAGNNPSSVVTDEDFTIVRKLQSWLKTNPKNQALYEAGLSVPEVVSGNVITNFNENDLDLAASIMNMQSMDKTSPKIDMSRLRLTNFSNISKDIYVDLVCQICAICDNKGVKFLLVWDGTKSNLAVHQENEFSIETTLASTATSAANADYQNKIFYSKQINDYMFPIYVFDEFVMILDNLEPGDFILLKNVRTCAPPANSDADLLIKMPGIQNNNQSKYGRAILKLASFKSAERSEFTIQSQETSKVIETIFEKSKEFNLTFITEQEFRAEYKTALFNDTFADLLEKNPRKSDPKLTEFSTKKPMSILSQVNQMMDEDTQMYYSSESESEKSPTKPVQTEPPQQILTENINIVNIEQPPEEIHVEAMMQDIEPEPDNRKKLKKNDPLEISQDIFKLKRLTNLTYLCPSINPDTFKAPIELYQNSYPFYPGIKNLIVDSKTKPFIMCKLIAKLFNYSISSCPHIATVFVGCKHCNYINFTPFHLANNYQSGTLTNILSNSDKRFDSSSQIPGQTNPSVNFPNFDSIPQTHNEDPVNTNHMNFSLNWLEFAYPSVFEELTPTQPNENESAVTYNYICPRCQANNPEFEGRELDYIYRFWFVLRDADGILDPCLLEGDLAENFLEGISPYKFYTNPAKAHQVYKILHKNFNKKFLFTLEAYNLKNDENVGILKLMINLIMIK